MKLLILTQKIDADDDVSGFFHSWVAAFAKRCEKVTVIALGVGEYNFSNNVKILSLGKEKSAIISPNFKIIKKIKYVFNFFKYIWQEKKNYNAVFVHMNTEYLILGGPVWRLLGKKTGLWYVHKQAGLKLKIAEKLADVIFTASRESCQLKSAKLKIIGHGVDFDRFEHRKTQVKDGNIFKIIYVGRISQIKNQKLLIKALNSLINKKGLKNVVVNLVGGPIYQKDKDYESELKGLVKDYRLEDQVNFLGSIPYREIEKAYQQANLSINLCPTGGADKAVLESMATGLPVIVHNKTFIDLLGGYDGLILENPDEEELADKISGLMSLSPEALDLIGQSLRDKVVKEFSLISLIDTIVLNLS